MGRFYWGDIEGKFWFGVQDSNDIENLINISHNSTYTWKVCECSADINYDSYCHDCYNNYKNHKKAIYEEEDAICDDDENESEELYYEDNTISYEIYKEDHYDELLKSLKELRSHISNKVLNVFDNIANDEKLLNAFEGAFNETSNIYNEEVNKKENNTSAVHMARYTLGLQIKYCLEKNGDCGVYCEC